ncbi:unnamed protein product [Effrenium voratum]|nr:unnamed protein product [Effrenium voratum]
MGKLGYSSKDCHLLIKMAEIGCSYQTNREIAVEIITIHHVLGKTWQVKMEELMAEHRQVPDVVAELSRLETEKRPSAKPKDAQLQLLEKSVPSG